jgi:cell fate (sporulation/competence/biofilm development) regulator YlbF (YheA/YmcA/DUF963 family)
MKGAKIMDSPILNELELAAPEVVRQAARDFAQVLAETTQFKAFEQANDRLNNDEQAQRVLEAFQAKQQSLRAMLMLNAASAEETAELERLRAAVLADPSVAAYLQAQQGLTAVCHAAVDLLSQQIGLNFASACRPCCC